MKVSYNKKEYREYLQSDEWKSLRSTVLAGKPDCQVCREKKAKDVHHLVYRNIVDVKVTDLLPVCRGCHDYIHQAIRDGYISQEAWKLEETREKTINILSDEKYKKYNKWLGDKHYLDDDLLKSIEETKSKTGFVARRISGLIKKHVWYDNIHEFKFTGRQIEKIRKFVDLANKRSFKKRGKSSLFKRVNRGKGGSKRYF